MFLGAPVVLSHFHSGESGVRRLLGQKAIGQIAFLVWPQIELFEIEPDATDG